MMKWWLVVALGCGGSNDKPVEEKKVEEGGLSSRFGSLADKAKEVGGDMAGKAKDVVGEKAGDLVEKAKEVAAKAGDLSTDALSSGKQLKSDLAGKLDFASSHFDIAIDSASESESDYKARIAGMKQIKVGDYTVGIAEDSKHPLGTVYKWQFRLTWRVPTGQAVRLSLFTDEPLDQLATATNLLTIVQASEKLLKLK
ncbi:MAG: hypothetical protein ABI867_16675 [Kofleriaceae bacterium]